LANSNPEQDLENIKTLAQYLTSAVANKVVLISTVDTVVKNIPYATNRKFLEEQVQTLPNYNIIRLCSLIGPSIKKNILYDLKHNQYLEQINLQDQCQWYPLDQLSLDIEKIISKNQSMVNLVSEPVENLEIVNKFASDKQFLMSPGQKNYYNLQPYYYSKRHVFEAMEKYFAN
jgi:hypothetical protein